MVLIKGRCDMCVLKSNNKTLNTLLLDSYKLINNYEIKNRTMIMEGEFEELLDDIEIYLEDEELI